MGKSIEETGKQCMQDSGYYKNKTCSSECIFLMNTFKAVIIVQTSGRMLSNVPYWKTSVTRTKQSTNACVRLNGEKHKFLEFHWSQLYPVHCGKQKFEILSWFAFHFYFMIRWLLFWFSLEGVFKSLCKTDQTNFCSADKNPNARTW